MTIHFDHNFGEPTPNLKNEDSATKIKESESLLFAAGSLFHATGYGLIQLDKDGKLVFANAQLKQICGFEPEKLLGMHFTDLFILPESDTQLSFIDYIQQVINSGSVELRIRGNTKITQWVKVSATIIPEKNADNPDYLIVIHRITSERKNCKYLAGLYEINSAANRSASLLKLLDETEEILKTFYRFTKVKITLLPELHKPAQRLYFLDKYQHFYEEVNPGAIEQYILKEKKPLLLTQSETMKLVYSGRVVISGKIPFLYMGTPLFYQNKIIGTLVCSTENSKHKLEAEDFEQFQSFGKHISLAILKKKLEEETMVEKTYFRYLFENSPEAIAVADKTGAIKAVNAEFIRLFRYSPDETINSELFTLLPDESYRKESVTFIRNTFKNKKQYIETVRRRNDGILMDVSILSTPVTFDENTRMAYFIYHDISERKENEKQLKEAKEKAEESDRLKSSFISNLSHEIRTPLNAIVGFSGLLVANKELNPIQKGKYIEHINNGCDSLVQLIDNLIDISEIEAKTSTLFKERFSLGVQLDEMLNIAIIRLKDKNKPKVVIKKQYQSELLPTIYTDKARLRQIILSLLDNAIKFTLEGSVEIDVDLNQPDYISIKISDSGIGIQKSDLDKIFNRFIKIQDNKGMLFRGTGVGLYMAKSMAQELGGSIKVKSEHGKGSVFSLQIPVSADDSLITQHRIDRKEKNKKPLLEGKRILVVEDNRSHYIYLEAILSHTHADIQRVKTGKQALQYLMADTVTDLVLLNMELSDMEGFELCNKIKEKNIQTPIIAQIPFEMDPDNLEALCPGFNNYLIKPIKPKLLFEAIHKLLS